MLIDFTLLKAMMKTIMIIIIVRSKTLSLGKLIVSLESSPQKIREAALFNFEKLLLLNNLKFTFQNFRSTLVFP